MTSDVSKLPKWARDEIHRLEANSTSLQKQMADMLGDGGRRVFLERFRDLEDQPLPDHVRVAFMLGPTSNSRVTVLLDENCININGYSPIAVYPGAANVVSIMIAPR